MIETLFTKTKPSKLVQLSNQTPNFKMVDTKELMTACFKAKTKEEMWLCRDLALSIKDRSPFAWKLYYSGEAEECLSDTAVKALKLMMRRAEKIDEKRRARKRLEFEDDAIDKPTKKLRSKQVGTLNRKIVEEVRSKRKGVKIDAFCSDEDEGVGVELNRTPSKGKGPIGPKSSILKDPLRRSARVNCANKGIVTGKENQGKKVDNEGVVTTTENKWVEGELVKKVYVGGELVAHIRSVKDEPKSDEEEEQDEVDEDSSVEILNPIDSEDDGDDTAEVVSSDDDVPANLLRKGTH